MAVRRLFTPARLAIIGLLLSGLALFHWLGKTSTKYEVAPVQRGDIEATVTAMGSLQPRRYVDVGAQVSGQVLRLAVQAGSQVKKGELLMEIDPSVQQATVDAGRAALAGLRAQLAEQQAQLHLARLQHGRQQALAQIKATAYENVDIAEATLATAEARIEHLHAQIAQAQATQQADEARLGYTRIFAPMAGTVVTVEAREGQTLNATYQTPNILRIADLTSMTVWTEVSEADISRVSTGRPVHFTTLGGHTETRARRWASKIRQILPAPVLNSASTPQNGQAQGSKAVNYTVLFDVDNPDGALMPQMTAQVSIVTAAAQGVIKAPLAALTGLAEERPVARVMKADGSIEQRTLRLGVRDRHVAEVLEGLNEGEQLVLAEAPDTGGPRRFTW